MARYVGVCGVTVCILLALFVSSCSFMASTGSTAPAPRNSPPAHAPAHGVRHSYVYYPSSYVYFEPARGVYFYLEGGTWKTAVSLPSSITIVASEGISLELETDRPHIHFDAHKKRYPPGQLKKKGPPPGKGRGHGKRR